MSSPLLTIDNLVKHFPVNPGVLLSRALGQVRAVDGVSLDVFPEETLGLVGESGCGKSTVANLVLRLLRPTSGSIQFNGDDVLTLKGAALRDYRRSVQVVFQDHSTSFNPRMTVSSIITEPLTIHKETTSVTSQSSAELLEMVGLPSEFANRFPHELSGGERQRVAIARAIALKPKLIIGDEPVSALDVSVRAQILNLLNELKSTLGLSYLFISHDLGSVRHICDRVAVMYLGQIVETAKTEELFTQPHHPYTQSLLSAAPLPDPGAERTRSRIILSGEVPSATDPPDGCRFHPRCPIAKEVCYKTVPTASADHQALCHFSGPFPIPAS